MKPYPDFESFRLDLWLFEASGLPGCISAYNRCRSYTNLELLAAAIYQGEFDGLDCYDTCRKCRPREQRERKTLSRSATRGLGSKIALRGDLRTWMGECHFEGESIGHGESNARNNRSDL